MRSSLILVLCLSMPALAVPTTVGHQGRLLDALAVPLDGDHDLSVTLYDDPASGTVAWTETLTDVPFDNGYFQVVLGESTPLDSSVLTGDVMYVALAVDGGSELPTRLPLGSVPYALQADSVSGGVVDASEIRVGGTTVIDSSGVLDSGALPAGSDTLASLSCSDGEIARLDSGSWTCAADDDHSHSHTHDAGDVLTGTLAIGRLPVGASSSEVAAGDHTHDASDVLTGTLAIARLPVGAGSTNVAAGDHGHSSLSGDVAVSGTLTIGGAGASCSAEGQLRWDSGALEVCDGSDWVAVYGGVPGTVDNPGMDCNQIYVADPTSPTGTYWIDPAGTGAFQVDCEMDLDGAGWIRLTSDRARNYWNMSYSGSNNSNKCGYDGLSLQTDGNYQFDHLTTVDGCPQTYDVDYQSAGSSLSVAQMQAIRGRVGALHSTTPLIAGGCDSDGYEPGWEAFAVAEDSSEQQLTTKTEGNVSWGTDSYEDTLGAEFLLPKSFRLEDLYSASVSCGNGGGVIAGWGADHMLVR